MEESRLTVAAEKLVAQICEGSAKKDPRGPYMVAIDGRCAAGKSTLAARVAKALLARGVGCSIVPMDDFFLRPEQRTPSRFAIPGENIDHERFLSEVLIPLHRGLSRISYRPFDCSRMTLAMPHTFDAKQVVLVEGSYCCHRNLFRYYDLRVFLDIDPARQKDRILKRNGEQILQRFISEWIPLEEEYHATEQLRHRCDVYLHI